MASPFDPQYNDIISRIRYYAGQHGIDSNIGIWQIWQESRFKPTVCSHAGACGIAQFMPATARRFNVNRNDINSSLNGWGKYMRFLLDKFNGDYKLALAGYNAGEGNVMKYNGIPPFRETQNYVATILGNAGQPKPNPVTQNVNITSNNNVPSSTGITETTMIAGAVLFFLILRSRI